ncbi:MAG: trypsin-like peptidase domain-containing protein [Balneolaceae bacterium]
MKIRDKFLSGVLLLLIGVLVGIIITLIRQGSFSFDLAEVRYTEVNRSEMPMWTNEDLEKIDDRFVFSSIAKNVTPTVVYIETVVPTRSQNFRGNGDEEEDSMWRQFMPPRANTVGSGVLISSDGYILTNNHVVEHAVRDGITVTLQDKRTYEARIVGRDPSTDLAVIKVDEQNLPQLTVGNSNQIQVGEWVLAVGNPLRLQSTVTAGIVSALGRDVQIIDDILRIESFIQTDAAINRGNSGGALVNTSGELIGINTAIATQSGNYQGYGFAVPSNLAMKVAEDLIEFGEIRRGMLGISIQSVNDELAERAGLERIRGVIVSDVTEDGAANKGGINPSDIILEVNEEEVNESNQLQEKVAMFRPGTIINLTIWRDGEILTREVELQELVRPEPEPLSFEEQLLEPEDNELEEIPEGRNGSGIEYQKFNDLGFSVQGLASPEDPQELDLYIHRVDSESPAQMRGLKQGYKILEINGEKVATLSVLQQKIEESQNNGNSLNLKIETESGSIGYYKLN